ncbi:MAG: hypothetical protein RL291_611 [Pseudomonadota bacterium]
MQTTKPTDMLSLTRPNLRGRFSALAMATIATALTLSDAVVVSASAQAPAPEAAARVKIPAHIEPLLNPRQKDAYLNYLRFRAVHDQRVTVYWTRVEELRDRRRAKHRAKQPMTAEDYVGVHPPVYQGPQLAPDIRKIIELARARNPEPPKPPMANVADFLANAKQHYNFVPTRIPELEFKRRYAAESLALGLSKEQVTRVYALETGGQGTADMQSGINPITRTGTPISSALGYAQLLNANSTSELVKHGDAFIQRLLNMAQQPGTPPRRVEELQHKANVLRAMLVQARSVPNEWSAHVRFAATGPGLGIHAINMDGDIGPWLQVNKLRGVLASAQADGRQTLTGAELELMNLAGPRTGLEMMTPLGRLAPTANFFSQGGYQRNPIVHNRTGAELLAQLDVRMDVHIKKPGAIEFIAVFDSLLSGQPLPGTQPRADRPVVDAPAAAPLFQTMQ